MATGAAAIVQNLGTEVILPIAGLVLTGVLFYELLSTIMDRNTFHEVDSAMFIKFIFKCCITAFLVSYAPTIVNGVYDTSVVIATQSISSFSDDITELGNQSDQIARDLVGIMRDADSKNVYVVKEVRVTGYGPGEVYVGGGHFPGIVPITETTYHQSSGYGIGDMLFVLLVAMVSYFITYAVNIAITVVIGIRFIEMLMYSSFAPLPAATSANKEWGNIHNNYLRNIFALAFQIFIIVVIVGIYSALILNAFTLEKEKAVIFQPGDEITISDNGKSIEPDFDSISKIDNDFVSPKRYNDTMIFGVTYSVLTIVLIMKSGQISKSLFHAQ